MWYESLIESLLLFLSLSPDSERKESNHDDQRVATPCKWCLLPAIAHDSPPSALVDRRSTCEQVWQDYQLRWDEADYGGISVLRLPSDKVSPAGAAFVHSVITL